MHHNFCSDIYNQLLQAVLYAKDNRMACGQAGPLPTASRHAGKHSILNHFSPCKAYRVDEKAHFTEVVDLHQLCTHMQHPSSTTQRNAYPIVDNAFVYNICLLQLFPAFAYLVRVLKSSALASTRIISASGYAIVSVIQLPFQIL